MTKAKPKGATTDAKVLIPELPTVRMKLKDLVPDEKNSRKITPARLAVLRDRLQRFGHAGVFVFNQQLGKLVGGHQRVKALIALLGEDYEVDVKVGKWNEAEHRALRVALNTHDGAWDHAMLAEDMATIKDLDPSLLSMSGLGAEKITMLLEGIGRAPPPKQGDELREPGRIQKPKNPVSKRGDVWTLGRHRVMCGDATSPEDMKRLMAGHLADLVHTDPPYGVDYKDGAILNDALQGDALLRMLHHSLVLMATHSKPEAAFYIWHADSNADDFRDAMKRAAIQKLQTLLWVKPSPAPTRSDYQYQHEPCFYACKDGQSPAFYGDRANMTVWTIGARDEDGSLATVLGKGIHVVDGDGNGLWIERQPPTGKKVRRHRLTEGRPMFLDDPSLSSVWFVQRERAAIHPTQKPVALPAKAIANSTKEGGRVLDPYGGSGSTLFAADQLNRVAHIMELDAGWVDVIVQTWEKETGQKATREEA